MAHLRGGRIGDMKTLVSLMRKYDALPVEPIQQKRQLVAGLCKLLGSQLGSSNHLGPGAGLPPRLHQTLGRLLAGDSEKQIAARLGVSPHTIHVYVKNLYKRYKVNSRGELLAHFLASPEQVIT